MRLATAQMDVCVWTNIPDPRLTLGAAHWGPHIGGRTEKARRRRRAFLVSGQVDRRCQPRLRSIQALNSPTMPRRNSSTQITKIEPMTTGTGREEVAR
ncbi:hypothetical protein EV666_103271 [Camelimonas lactis]|uniref:Uncharacterized protein n=1 Tax=Camelimonas lactis TaxID=659006 RepID=A0A4R2GVR9_9HYPH|nr:hypothetical protein EV666_103271 [Camelimonas lactis]